jgi:hypothetical protein
LSNPISIKAVSFFETAFLMVYFINEERRKEVRQLKHRRDRAINDVEKNYYKQ